MIWPTPRMIVLRSQTLRPQFVLKCEPFTISQPTSTRSYDSPRRHPRHLPLRPPQIVWHPFARQHSEANSIAIVSRMRKREKRESKGVTLPLTRARSVGSVSNNANLILTV